MALRQPPPPSGHRLADQELFALLAGQPWRDVYPLPLVILADRLLLGRAEDEPPLGLPEDV